MRRANPLIFILIILLILTSIRFLARPTYGITLKIKITIDTVTD